MSITDMNTPTMELIITITQRDMITIMMSGIIMKKLMDILITEVIITEAMIIMVMVSTKQDYMEITGMTTVITDMDVMVTITGKITTVRKMITD